MDVFSLAAGSNVSCYAVEEAYDLGRRSIYHATYRDAYSGGSVNRMINYIHFILIEINYCYHL